MTEVTKSQELEDALMQFTKMHHIEPTHIAISVHDFMQLRGEKYLPGIRIVSIEEFKKHGTMFMGIPMIWKEGVLC